MSPPLEREALLPRIDGIRKNIKKLEELASLPLEEFSKGDPFDLAQHHLRLALESIFHISTHILSRLSGGRSIEYKEIALKMGEHGIVPQIFAQKMMVPMAGLRNILVHNYSDIQSERLHNIVKNHRQDIEQFLQYIKVFLKKLDQFGLTLS